MTTLNILEDYVDRDTLAERLRLSTRTIWRYENLPDGLPSLTLGGRKYYRIATVQNWLAKRERQLNPRRA
ncbi:hypothetical protein ELI41_29645 (plasmid) [Rhizobium leguminosarum]|uniref:helix-turn-helix transcriptional regulator n=1 Tax=Rhizobium leguminosarum TaxID=384 RepID=UPI00102FE6CF|nr:hypothetical protein [Rhizobium leguminosarum]TAU80472.1 hypothetical protein ELI41_29645 [Rhizobium leguminosarum]